MFSVWPISWHPDQTGCTTERQVPGTWHTACGWFQLADTTLRDIDSSEWTETDSLHPHHCTASSPQPPCHHTPACRESTRCLPQSVGASNIQHHQLLITIILTTRRPSLEGAPTILATFLSKHEFLNGCYLITVSNSGLLFGDLHPALGVAFPISFSLFN